LRSGWFFFFPGWGVELADCGVELVDCGVALADCGVDSKASPLGVEVSTSREFLWKLNGDGVVSPPRGVDLGLCDTIGVTVTDCFSGTIDDLCSALFLVDSGGDLAKVRGLTFLTEDGATVELAKTLLWVTIVLTDILA